MENFIENTADWLACTQSLLYFSFRKHRRAWNAGKKNKHDSDWSIFFLPHYYPLALAVNKSPAVLFFITHSTDFEEKTEGLGTGPGGGTRYILGWGGAARPFIPWPCLRQISLIFLPCLRQNSDFLIPCLRHLSCLRQKFINRYPG